ncbi:MAG: hypothetical protein ACP5VE_11905 [Chthonomonadales bacterium]
MTHRTSRWEDGRWAPIAIIVTLILVAALLGYFFWYAPSVPVRRGFPNASAELEDDTFREMPARPALGSMRSTPPVATRIDRFGTHAASRPR